MSRATELAKCLDLYDDDQTAVHAADELRRLDRVNAELVKALREILADMDSEFGTDYEYSKARALTSSGDHL